MNVTDFNETTGSCVNTSCECEYPQDTTTSTTEQDVNDMEDEGLDESEADSIPPLVEGDCDGEGYCDECGGKCDGVHSGEKEYIPPLVEDTHSGQKEHITSNLEELLEHFNNFIVKKPVFVIKINDEIKGYVSSEEEAQRTLDLQYEKILLTQIHSSYRMYTEKTSGKTLIYGNYRFMGIISYNQILYTLSYERVNRL